MADRIELTGLSFTACHGVLAEEHDQRQPFVVDVTVWFDQRPAAQSDDVTCTVDYAELARIVYAVGTGPHVDLIETLAARMADAIMVRWVMLNATEVTVHKPEAPIGLAFSDVAVVARRSRKRQGALP